MQIWPLLKESGGGNGGWGCMHVVIWDRAYIFSFFSLPGVLPERKARRVPVRHGTQRPRQDRSAWGDSLHAQVKNYCIHLQTLTYVIILIEISSGIIMKHVCNLRQRSIISKLEKSLINTKL